jgi:hypothetical protein
MVVGSPVSAGKSVSDSWAEVGEKEALNLAGRALMDTMLAVWIGLEMKEEAVEEENGLLVKVDTNGKIIAQQPSGVRAYALASEALVEQVKAEQKTIDGLFSKQARKLQELEKSLTLASASTKTYDGLFKLSANSLVIGVTPKADQEMTTLTLQALRPTDRPEARASVQIFGADYASMLAFGGAGVQVGCEGARELTQIGNASICSGREGKLAMKMGHFNEPHAMLLHKDGVKIFSREGGIHILHGASAKFAEIEAAEAPRKIVIESRDAPVEIRADRILLKAGISIRMECGANFIEMNETGIIQNGITTSTAADAAFMELASMQIDGP